MNPARAGARLGGWVAAAVRPYFARRRERCWEIYERTYGASGFRTQNDQYWDAILQHVTPSVRLLDAGCGYHLRVAKALAPKIGRAVGIDLGAFDANVPGVLAVRGDLSALPFRAASFDLIVSKHVLEHVTDPEEVFAEFSRVLGPGGVVIALTPNQYGYIPMLSRVAPYWVHRKLLSILIGRSERDTFPTAYRANSRKRLTRLLRSNGFEPVEIRLLNQYPSYLMFSVWLFRLGILFERLTTRFETLRDLRGSILVIGKKARIGDAGRGACDAAAPTRGAAPETGEVGWPPIAAASGGA